MAETIATITIYNIPLLIYDEAIKAISNSRSSTLYSKGKTGGKKHYIYYNKDNYSSEDYNSQKTYKKYKVKGYIKQFCLNKKKKKKENDDDNLEKEGYIGISNF
jgi:hypothetical protein